MSARKSSFRRSFYRQAIKHHYSPDPKKPANQKEEETHVQNALPSAKRPLFGTSAISSPLLFRFHTSPSINSPPPQNKPSPQNLRHNHNAPATTSNHPSTPPTRPRLNNQRSPTPRIRGGRQIVSLRVQCRAEAALLLDDRRRRLLVSSRHDSAASARAVPVLCCRGLLPGRGLLVVGGCGRGLVGVAVGEGAGALAAVAGGAAADLLVVGVLADGVGGAAAVERRLGQFLK